MHPLRAMLASVSAATALLAGPGLASAVIPIGSFEIQFGGRQSIWMGEEGVDPSEEFCADFGAAFDVLESCDFEAYVDGKGKIYGYFGFAGWSGGVHFAEGGLIKGTQKGDDRSGISRVSFKIKLTGTASYGFETLPTRSSIRLSGETTAEGLVSGVWTVRVCIKGVGCSEDESQVPPTTLTNGGWSLELEITDGGDDELGGSARVEFGDGSDCFYAVSGKYRAKKDTARLSLLPTEPECEKTSIRLKDVHLLTPLRLEDSSRASVLPDPISGLITYRLFGFRGNTEFDNLPGSSPIRQSFPVSGGVQGGLSGHYSHQELFAFICEGTVAIAASVDPASCSWTIPSNRDELAIRQWTLAEELQRAVISRDDDRPGIPQEPSFGRRSFGFFEEKPIYRDERGAVLTYTGASMTISVIEAPTALEERARLAELEP